MARAVRHLPAHPATRGHARACGTDHDVHTATVPAPRPHLSYCTNIHPGETWAEVRENLTRYLVPVRERFAPGRPFGIGLRLSGVASEALADREALAEFRAFLDAHELYVFTINGFP